MIYFTTYLQRSHCLSLTTYKLQKMMIIFFKFSSLSSSMGITPSTKLIVICISFLFSDFLPENNDLKHLNYSGNVICHSKILLTKTTIKCTQCKIVICCRTVHCVSIAIGGLCQNFSQLSISSVKLHSSLSKVQKTVQIYWLRDHLVHKAKELTDI